MSVLKIRENASDSWHPIPAKLLNGALGLDIQIVSEITPTWTDGYRLNSSGELVAAETITCTSLIDITDCIEGSSNYIAIVSDDGFYNSWYGTLLCSYDSNEDFVRLISHYLAISKLWIFQINEEEGEDISSIRLACDITHKPTHIYKVAIS